MGEKNASKTSSPERANLFLASIGYEMTQREELRCTDVGTWELTNDMGEVFTSCGSLVPNEKQLQILSDEQANDERSGIIH